MEVSDLFFYYPKVSVPKLAIGITQIAFFLENALKKTTEYFPKFLFLFESTIFPFNNGK